MRGCSRKDPAKMAGSSVFPAYAGVLLFKVVVLLISFSPRMRGCSHIHVLVLWAWFSPRMRGCFSLLSLANIRIHVLAW